MLVEPRKLFDVIWLSPPIREKKRSSGVATLDAIVSGLAPGNEEDTCMVGKSICGNGATGSKGQVTMPTSSSAAASSEVPIGRLMKIAETFTGYFFSGRG